MDELIELVKRQAKLIQSLQNQLEIVNNKVVSLENDLQKIEENMGVSK